MDSLRRMLPIMIGVWMAAGAAAAMPAGAPHPAPGADWRASIRAFAQEHFRNPAWGYSHSVRDYELARQLAAKDGVRLDADALDWLGAIGVARIIALADPNGAAPDGPAVVKMLEDNLAHVPARVLSPAGRRAMPARREELRRYLAELRTESDGLRAL